MDADAIRIELTTGSPIDRLIVALSHANRGEWSRAAEVLLLLDDEAVAALSDRMAFRVRVVRARAPIGSGR